MVEPVLRRTESQLTAADGTTIFLRSWSPEKPERQLLLVHGYAEHSGRYDHVAAAFAARGFVVDAFDHRGHGRSGGVRCHVDRFADFLDDIDAVHVRARDRNGVLPATVLGHSMGGLLTLAWMIERQPLLASAIVSAPALTIGSALPAWRRLLAKTLRRIRPTLAMASDLDATALSRDTEVQRRYLEDPLIELRMTMALGAELMEGADRTAASAGALAVPTLLIHGEDDPLCPVEASREFYAGVRSEGSDLRTYPGLRHEILNEPEHPRILEEILAWQEALVD